MSAKAICQIRVLHARFVSDRSEYNEYCLRDFIERHLDHVDPFVAENLRCYMEAIPYDVQSAGEVYLGVEDEVVT